MTTDEGMDEMSRGVPASAEMRECNGCGWIGYADECVHPKHVPSQLLCPVCNETTFVIGCQAGQ
jgi:hypothetical protein